MNDSTHIKTDQDSRESEEDSCRRALVWRMGEAHQSILRAHAAVFRSDCMTYVQNAITGTPEERQQLAREAKARVEEYAQTTETIAQKIREYGLYLSRTLAGRSQPSVILHIDDLPGTPELPYDEPPY